METQGKTITLESNQYGPGTIERFKEHIPNEISYFFTCAIDSMDIIPNLMKHPFWQRLVAEFGIDKDNEDEFMVAFVDEFDLAYKKIRKAASAGK
jgi:hypothetical protein